VRLPRGSLIEPSPSARTQQSAVVAKDYVFRLNPKEIRPVLIEAECWNRHLAPPKNAPGVVTPFSGKVQETTEVWSVSSHAAESVPLFKPSAKTTLSEFVAEVGGEWACDVYEFIVKKSMGLGGRHHSTEAAGILRYLNEARNAPSKR